MIIKKLSSTAVKISISRNEMKEYGVDFEDFNENNGETVIMINDILKKIKYNTGLNLISSKLFVEAFSTGSGSDCIIYISTVDEDDEETYEPCLYYLFDFENIKNCTGFLNHLSDEYAKAFISCSLYYLKPVFRLAVKITAEYEEYITACASEFGTISGYGETAYACTDEHYDCIIRENAVEKLSGISLFK